MFPNGQAFTPTEDVRGVFNTFGLDDEPITLTDGVLRLERNRSGTWSEITGAGITLAVDEDDTGRHEYVIDLDHANIVAAAGDLYRVALNAGTVDGKNVVGTPVGYFYVEAAGLTTAQKADVNAEADTALVDIHLDHLLATDYDPSSKPGTSTALLNELVENDGGVSRFTANAVEQAWAVGTRTLTSFGTLVSDVATAVWGAATRLLTAGTNIVLAKGTGVTGFNDLSAAQVNAEVDAAIADAALATAAAVADLPTNAEFMAALAAADDAVLAAIAALNNLSAAQVNAEVLDVIATDTRAEPGQGAPAATTSLGAKIDYLYKAYRNKSVQTATTQSLYNDAGSTVDQKRTISDDDTEFTAEEVVSGP